MKTVKKAEWVAALRSGKYEQGRNYLKTRDNKFCCLGVLSELYETPSELGSHAYTYKFDELDPSFSNYTGGVPPELMDMAGVDSNYGSKLARMNDKGDSFNEIADFIEKLS